MKMKLFLNRGNGSVTVYVTLILIPTIFFTAFLGDLARVKLYGNIALMSADNYAESILTEYDDLLRELYGFFAVSQNEKGEQAVKTLMNYSKTSFDPNLETISFQYLQDVTGTTTYSGYMPYNNANVELTKEYLSDSALTDDEVFATQMGDFMRFRIAQQLLMSGDMNEDGEIGGELLNMQNELSSHEGDMEVIDKQNEFADELEDYLECISEYYICLYLVENVYYKKYYNTYDLERSYVESIYNDFLNSTYKEYKLVLDTDSDTLNEVVNKKVKGDELTEEEEKLYNAIQNADKNYNAISDFKNFPYDVSVSAHRSLFYRYNDCKDFKIEDEIWSNIAPGWTETPYINMDNYESYINKLKDLSAKIANEAEDVKKAEVELKKALYAKDSEGNPKTSSQMRESIEADLKELDDLVTPETFYEIYEYLHGNVGENSKFFTIYSFHKNAFMIVDDLMYNNEIEIPEDEDLDIRKIQEYIDESKKADAYELNFKSVEQNEKFKEFYKKLSDSFNSKSSVKKSQADSTKDDANGKVDKAGQDISASEPEDTSLRNIPESYDFGGDNGGDSCSLKDMMKTVGNTFSNGSWGNTGNKILLKLYTVEYDFGMFSSRITPVTKEEELKGKSDGNNIIDNATGTSTVSLTGYEKCKSINYLYGSELEYIIHGSRDSKSNLNYTRNIICGFRMIMNFASSYSIGPVNGAIKGISTEFNAVPYIGPALAIIVEMALRFGFAALETKMEWENLIQGKSVLLYKKEVNQLESLQTLEGWLGDLDDSDTGEEDGLSLTYEQYVLILLLFMTSSEKINARTRNLIELNVNAVIKEVGDDKNLDSDYSKLPFKMSNTRTAVKTTCSVQSDFAIIPKGFAKAFLNAKTNEGTNGISYSDLEELEKTTYEYSVIRGY